MYVMKYLSYSHKPKEAEVQKGNVDEAQLYEEIKDPETGGATLRIITASTLSANTPDYEDVILTGADVVKNEDVNLDRGDTKSSNAYQITQCSAYGVSLPIEAGAD